MRRISVFVFFIVIYLFINVSNIYAASPTIISGYASKELAGIDFQVVCAPIPWSNGTSKFAHIDNNGNYYVEFNSSDCDSGYSYWFPDIASYTTCQTPTWCYSIGEPLVINTARNVIRDLNIDNIININVVPEYNQYTLLLAIFAAGISYFYFKKYLYKDHFIQNKV